MSARALDISRSLEAAGEINGLIANREIGQAVATYLRAYAVVSGKALFEWRLAAALLDADQGPEEHLRDLEWPNTLLARPSGAALRFTVAQIGHEETEPEAAEIFSTVPYQAMPTLARAWAAYPETKWLATPEARRRFANRMALNQVAAGHCMLAAGAAGDAALVEELAPAWLGTGTLLDTAPAILRSASKIPLLAQVTRRGIAIAAGRCYGDTGALLLLLEACFGILDSCEDLSPPADVGEAALRLSDVLIERGLPPEQTQRIWIWRLACLAALGEFERTAQEYKEHWIPGRWSYPHPELILHALQRTGDDDAERHLLATANLGETTQAWVLLTHRCALPGEGAAVSLEDWDHYLRVEWSRAAETGVDLRVLLAVTVSVLRTAEWERQRHADLEWRLQNAWKQLAKHADLGALACSILILLETAPARIIQQYEENADGTPPSGNWPCRAGHAYILALRRRKEWTHLSDLHARQPALFERCCTFSERRITRLMSEAKDLAMHAPVFDTWRNTWEQMLFLPLTARDLVDILEHFFTLQQQPAVRTMNQENRGACEDLRLQLLRRARAEAERLLERAPEAQHKLRARLSHADVEETWTTLNKLLLGG